MMKKTIVLGLLMFVLSLPCMGMTATIGNIAETQGALWKLCLGVGYEGMLDRDMVQSRASLTVISEGKTYHGSLLLPGESMEDVEMASNRIFLKGTLGLHPNVDIFMKLKIADANWEATVKKPVNPDEKLQFEDDWDLSWGIGTKVKIFQTSGGLRFMADAQYMRCELDGNMQMAGQDANRSILNDILMAKGVVDPNATLFSDSKTEIEEWHIALFVNQTFGNFSPYIGAKYSDFKVNWEFEGNGQILGTPLYVKDVSKFEADDNFGIFLGTDIYFISNRLSINIEGKFIDETAVAIGVNYSF